MKFEKGLRTSNKQIIAIAYMIMSAFFFSAMQLAVKLTGTGTPFPIMEQVFFRNIIALLLLLPRVPASAYRSPRSAIPAAHHVSGHSQG